MKVSHEIPKQLFHIHDEINQYPYVLAHLLDKSSEYYDREYAEFYKHKLKDTEFSILDNSAYELGSSVNSKILFELGEKYKPTHIVLPDSYGNFEETKKLTKLYLDKYYHEGKCQFLAVLQGKTEEEYLDCYRFYCKYDKIDIIGINSTVVDRQWFISNLFDNFRVEKKIHLLGCINPGEFLNYLSEVKEKIHSIDTSSPIIHGWCGNKFVEDGYSGEKPKIKLAENLDIKLSKSQVNLILHNVAMFKTYIN